MPLNCAHWSFDVNMRQATEANFQVYNFEFVQFIIHWRLSELTLENEKKSVCRGSGSFIKILSSNHSHRLPFRDRLQITCYKALVDFTEGNCPWLAHPSIIAQLYSQRLESEVHGLLLIFVLHEKSASGWLMVVSLQ